MMARWRTLQSRIVETKVWRSRVNTQVSLYFFDQNTKKTKIIVLRATAVLNFCCASTRNTASINSTR